VTVAFVALAELGDKTQLLTMVLAAKASRISVILGVVGAILALQTLAVALGATVGSLIPGNIAGLISGVLFLGFGAWTLLASGNHDDHGADKQLAKVTKWGPVVGIALIFFLAELGDKTQLMTISIAANPAAAIDAMAAFGLRATPTAQTGGLVTLSVWLGSTAGMLLVNGLALLAGTLLRERLSAKVISVVSGVAFIGFGVAVLVTTLVV